MSRTHALKYFVNRKYKIRNETEKIYFFLMFLGMVSNASVTFLALVYLKVHYVVWLEFIKENKIIK